MLLRSGYTGVCDGLAEDQLRGLDDGDEAPAGFVGACDGKY